MISKRSSDKLEQLVIALKTLDSEQYFPYDLFRNDRIYFITQDNNILYGVTEWLKYLCKFSIRNISLRCDKDSPNTPSYISVKVGSFLFLWTIEETANGDFYLTETKIPENKDKYNDNSTKVVLSPLAYSFFSSVFPQLNASAETVSSDDIRQKAVIESLALCDFMYVSMVPDSCEYNKEFSAKPFVETINNTNRITISVHSDLEDQTYFKGYSISFMNPFLARISREDFEDMLNLSLKDPSLMLYVLYDKAKIEVPAIAVYKAIQDHKKGLENMDSEIKNRVHTAKVQHEHKHKNRIISSVASTVLIITAITAMYLTFRTPFVSKDSYRSIYSASKYGEINSYRGFKKKVVISEKTKIKSERSKSPDVIGKSAFAGKNIVSFISTCQLKFIEEEAFKDCRNLKTVKLNKGLREIHSRAFANCPVEEIEIPDTVYYLGEEIFAGANVHNITVGENLCKKFPEAFKNMTNDSSVHFTYTDDSKAFDPVSYVEFKDEGKTVSYITSPFEKIVIPEGVINLNLGNTSFRSNYSSTEEQKPSWIKRSNVTEMILPDSLQEIEEYSFHYSNIERITIPPKVKKLKTNTFSNSQLKEITLPEGLESIGSYCFFDTKLESIRIPDSVNLVEGSVFESCKMLKSVIIGNGIQKIPYHFFSGCESLEKVTIGENVKSIEKNAFKGCTNLEEIDFPDSLEKICEHAFDNTALRVVIIPKNVNTIERDAFPHTLLKVFILNPDCKVTSTSFKPTTKVYVVADEEMED